MIVENPESNIRHLGSLSLKPGPNRIDPKRWAEERKHPGVARAIERGDIIEHHDPSEQANMTEDQAKLADFEHLKTLKIPAAKSLVEETVDLSLLKEWAAREDRNVVKGVLTAQIGKLEAAPELRDRGQSRQIETGKGPEVIEVRANPSALDD